MLQEDIYDVVIAGCGIIGALTGIELKKAGKKCLILEAKTPFHSTSASAARTRAGHSLYSHELYRRLADISLGKYRLLPGVFHSVTPLLIAKESNTDVSFAKQVYQSDKERFVWLEKADTQKLYPALCDYSSCLDIQGGLLMCYNVNEIIVSLLSGLEIPVWEYSQIKLATPNTEQNFILQLSCGRKISTALVIIAAGLESQNILNLFMPTDDFLEESYPMIMHYKFKAGFWNIPPFAIIEEDFFHIPPVPGKCDSGKIGTFTQPFVSTGTEKVDLIKIADTFIRDFSQHVDFIDAPYDKCAYDKTNDGHFIVGPSSRNNKIILGCGLNGTGYKYAPLIAEMLAKSVLGDVDAVPEEWLPRRLGI